MRSRHAWKPKWKTCDPLRDGQRVFILNHGIGEELVHVRVTDTAGHNRPRMLMAGRMLDGMPGSPTVVFKLPSPFPAAPLLMNT